jgi:hypothetical protein
MQETQWGGVGGVYKSGAPHAHTVTQSSHKARLHTYFLLQKHATTVLSTQSELTGEPDEEFGGQLWGVEGLEDW